MQRMRKRVFEIIAKKIGRKDFMLLTPKHSQFGDYSLNTHPLKEISIHADDFKSIDLFEKVEEKNGFINFYIHPDIAKSELLTILSEKEDYGKNVLFKEKKTIVEYTDPNPFKEFHIGH